MIEYKTDRIDVWTGVYYKTLPDMRKGLLHLLRILDLNKKRNHLLTLLCQNIAYHIKFGHKHSADNQVPLYQIYEQGLQIDVREIIIHSKLFYVIYINNMTIEQRLAKETNAEHGLEKILVMKDFQSYGNEFTIDFSDLHQRLITAKMISDDTAEIFLSRFIDSNGILLQKELSFHIIMKLKNASYSDTKISPVAILAVPNAINYQSYAPFIQFSISHNYGEKTAEFNPTTKENMLNVSKKIEDILS